jgi:protein SCO1/2
MKNTFSVKKILILVVILALPGFLYYLLHEKGKNHYHPLGFFGAKQLAKTYHTYHGKKIPDTIYHTIQNFKLVNQKGDSVKFPDSEKITIVNFFFTRCPSFCRDMNKQMSRVVNTYQKNNSLRFFSITIDPEYDTPSVLSNYSKSYNARPGKWDFLTGEKDLIYKLARQDFLEDAIKDTSTINNFIHSPMLVLVDMHKHIRGYYDSGNNDQVDKLIDEIKVLIAEELRNKDHINNYDER